MTKDEQPIKDKLHRMTAEEEQGLGAGYREMLGLPDPFGRMTKDERIERIKEVCDKTPFHFATLDEKYGWICPSCKAKIVEIEGETE